MTRSPTRARTDAGDHGGLHRRPELVDVVGLVIAVALGVVVVRFLGAWWLAAPAALFLGLDVGEQLLQRATRRAG